MQEVAQRRRLTREESRAQTRERLLDAALAVFIEDGIETTSIEEVAEVAGYSRGAFYSNFASKDDLLCAVLEREVERTHREIEAILVAIAPEESIGKLRELYATMARDQRRSAFWLSAELYGLRNPAIRPCIAQIMATKRAYVIEHTRRVLSALGDESSTAFAETVALGLMSIAQGLAITRLLDPGAVSEELLPTMLETLFNRITGAS